MTRQISLVETRAIDGRVGLRLIRHRDALAWRDCRQRNQDWLRPWEATVPPSGIAAQEIPQTFGAMVRRMRTELREGRMIPWVITLDREFAGQLTVGGITYGSLRSAYIGYWVDQRVAGRGLAPTAVAMAIDYCLDVLGLHRIEINIRPENQASRRVVEKLGIHEEGRRPEYLHIDGQWRDHITYVVLEGEYPLGVLDHWRTIRRRLVA